MEVEGVWKKGGVCVCGDEGGGVGGVGGQRGQIRWGWRCQSVT